MSKNKLHNNCAEGDIAGRDILKYYIQNKNKSPLRQIVEKLEEDCLHDPNFNKYISDLIHFTNSIHPDGQRDLETKLTEANRQDELHEAEELKERFTKLLVKSSLSEQAQNAYVHVLSKIKVDYDHKVKPLLKSYAELSSIEASVHDVIMGIYEDLAGTVIQHNVLEIKGMLYFLTGNCHIEWKY